MECEARAIAAFCDIPSRRRHAHFSLSKSELAGFFLIPSPAAPARLPVFHLNMGRGAGSVYTASLRAPPSSSRLGQAGEWQGGEGCRRNGIGVGCQTHFTWPSLCLSSALRLVLLGKNGHRGERKWKEEERDTIVDARENVDAERPTLPEQRRLRLAKTRRPTAAGCVRWV